MKKILVTLLLISFGASVFAKEWKKIRIATEGAFPPFNVINAQGELEGMEIDFIKALCAEVKVECVIQTQDWDGIIPGLLAKKYDAIIASMSITDERMKSVLFSKPYYKAPNNFIAKKGMFKDVNPSTLEGKKIGVQKATISENFVRDNYPKSDLRSYVKIDDAYLDLTSGRIDLVFNDSVNTDEGFLQKESGKDYAFIGPDFVNPKWFGYGVGVAMRLEDKDLKAVFDKGIDALYANGEFKKINDKYFSYSIMIKK